MSTSRRYYVVAAALLLCALLVITFLAPEDSFWEALISPVGAAFIVLLLPALFGPLDESLKKWHRG